MCRAPDPEDSDLERNAVNEHAPSIIHFLGTNTVTVLSNRGRRDFSADLSMLPLAHLLTSLLGLNMSA